MKVLMDSHAFVSQSKGGVSRVLLELIYHLSKMDGVDARLFAGIHGNQYVLERGRIWQGISGNYLPPPLIKQRVLTPVNRKIFEHLCVKERPQVCHHSWSDLPKLPNSCLRVTTIHDMIPERFPELFEDRDYHLARKQRLIAAVDGIVCVSDTTREDLIRFYPEVKQKPITVVHHGNSLKDLPVKKPDITDPFLLYVGTRAMSYKNFLYVVKVVQQCRETHPYHLVCLGGDPFRPEEVQALTQAGILDVTRHVVCSDEELAGWYSAAHALVYPSRYEGFGLPPLEAMSLGCPVIAAKAPPLPGLYGDGCLWVNPDSPEEASAYVASLEEEEFRSGILQKTARVEERFSWQKAAAEVKMFYGELLERVSHRV